MVILDFNMILMNGDEACKLVILNQLDKELHQIVVVLRLCHNWT